MIPTRPTWAEVSRSRLRHNCRRLRSLAGPQTELLAVVKANAYGHGAAECAKALAADGVQWFGVTCVDEAMVLRSVCPDARILIMSGIWPGEAEAAVQHRLTPVVWEPQHLDWLDGAARRQGIGAGQFPIHLEIDTGMSRQGAPYKQAEALAERIGPESPLRLEALMTHFHSPENEEETRSQINLFTIAIGALLRRNFRWDFVSVGSSANLLLPNLLLQDESPLAELTKSFGTRRMIRAGLALYGYSPVASVPELEPVLAWKTRVTGLRDIDIHTAAGYGARFRAQRPTRLALLPVGYADGLDWQLWDRASVLIRGQRVPVAGRISMDQTLVDVTDLPNVAIGDEGVLIGEQGSEKITAADMAELCGTIAYEVLCGIGARVPRMMVD
ncbi:MAG TPA: alanine racemase [Acidobacteriaceae bacterium]|jgi:alanine racemase|nr:alanine racemase [Acidobacteriaceae bacterium]